MGLLAFIFLIGLLNGPTQPVSDTLNFNRVSELRNLRHLSADSDRRLIGVEPDGRTIKTQSLTDPDGVQTTRHSGTGGESFLRIRHLSLSPGGRILVTDAGLARLFLFDEWWRLLATWPRADVSGLGLDRPRRSAPRISHLESDGGVVAVDPESATILHYAADGGLREEYGFDLPVGVNPDVLQMDSHSLFVGDSVSGTVLRFTHDGVYERSYRFGPNLCCLTTTPDGLLAMSDSGLEYTAHRGAEYRLWRLPDGLETVSMALQGSILYVSTSTGIFRTTLQ